MKIKRWRVIILSAGKTAEKQKKHMKIAVACDHGGLNLKNAMIHYVENLGHEVVDFGTKTTDSCDYPDFAVAAAEAVASGECQRGIVVCSSGIGVSIVAN